MTVKISMLFFWVVTPCGFADRFKRFGRTYCFHLQDQSWGDQISRIIWAEYVAYTGEIRNAHRILVG
jgi:hypothetical protein